MSYKTLHPLTKKDLCTCDPMLLSPDQNIEHNVAEGIDDMTPDPDDVPSGFTIRGTQRPDVLEADAQGLVEKDLLRLKIMSLRK